jgi:hypothetical protein
MGVLCAEYDDGVSIPLPGHCPQTRSWLRNKQKKKIIICTCCYFYLLCFPSFPIALQTFFPSAYQPAIHARTTTTTVVLTKTAKKMREHKTSYVNAVWSAINASNRVYLFSYMNMRSNHFKDVRLHFCGRGDGREEGGAMVNEDNNNDNNVDSRS